MNTNLAISEREARRAVRDRDEAYDGRLFFAVVTTGIYCRPSCSSRQANAENLRFFDTAQLALAAGFRACKRCKPDNLVTDNPMVVVARYIEAHADQRITLSDLAAKFKLSPTHLQKAFSAVFGLSPKAFQNGIRQQRFKSLLREGQSVTDAVYAAGYGSSSRVYDNATAQLGMTPGDYKKGAKGEHISYSCGNTRFGYLMLAATDKGVCFAMFGRDETELLQLLQQEFPLASVERSPGGDQIDSWYAQIERYLMANQTLPTIPLDLRGSAFQIRVWQFLLSIANGEVVSYRDVAQGIDQPKAFRAAASACAKNRIALLVPCHRVLRGDGGIGGYRWGVETKRDLLEFEQALTKEGD